MFFGGSDEGPTPEQMETWRRRFTTPDNELPGVTPVGLVLGRTEELAVGITAVEAYTGGFSFKLAVRLRTERVGGLGHRLYELIAGHSHPDAEPPAADERLLLGLEYADGRVATNINPMPWPADPRAGELAEDEVMLAQSEGGGGGRSFDQGYWVTPLPPPGPLAFVCAWPVLGIAESRTTVDAALIIEAAARAQVLWTWQPDEPQPFPPPQPPAPSSGWFADAVRRRPDPPQT
jgi:hypothetical protein